MNTDAIIAAAEKLNQANVSVAQASGARLYRDAMTPEARTLDEAFQAYYESLEPATIGLRSVPMLSRHVEIDAKSVGMSLKMSEETRREIEEIERNSALAMLNARNIFFD